MTKSEQGTREHIGKVRYHMATILANLAERSNAHDLSKLEEPELSGYESLRQAMQGVEYGTPAYKAVLAAHEGIIQHHYASNTHHPEHWPNGVEDMSLLDIIEMLADWKAASERGERGFQHSLEVSIARFHFDDDRIGQILINTAKELGWL